LRIPQPMVTSLYRRNWTNGSHPGRSITKRSTYHSNFWKWRAKGVSFDLWASTTLNCAVHVSERSSS
jgi:hypothetical protein